MSHIQPARKGDRSDNRLAVLIIAAGPISGRRMQGPPSLYQLPNGQTLIDHQIKVIRKVYPQARAVLVCGYQASKVIKAVGDSILVVEKELYEESGQTRSISMGLRVIDEPNLLLIHGDIFFNSRAIDGLFSDESCILVDNVGQIASDAVGINCIDGKVQRFSFGISPKWGQISFFCGQELQLLKDVSHSRRNDRLFTFETLNKVIDRGGWFNIVQKNDAVIKEVSI